MEPSQDLLESLTAWAARQSTIRALVLFGSRARPAKAAAAADGWSDIDLHVITTSPRRVEDRAWAEALPGHRLCMHVVRPASGGVRKVTLVYSDGEADLVVIPAGYFRRLRRARRAGLHRRDPRVGVVLNELSTIMRGGYRFLKDEDGWERFYAGVVAEMPGQRLGDREIENMAGVFLCDLLWVCEKIERGELVAAQRVLHRSLSEINFQLTHEARLRRRRPTFREARRVERLLSAAELGRVRVSARLDASELRGAARRAHAGLVGLMSELRPGWGPSAGFLELLEPYLRRRR
jgi:hypothetical protein